MNIHPIQAAGRLTPKARKAIIAYGDGYSTCDYCRKPFRLDKITRPGIDDFHGELAKFLNADQARVVPGARRAFQAVASALVEKGDSVIVSAFAHYTEFLAVEQAGGIVKEVPKNEKNVITADAAAQKIEDVKKEKGRLPALIMIDHFDYVQANEHDVYGIARVAKQYGIPFLYNGAYTVGIAPVDAKKIGADFVVGSGQASTTLALLNITRVGDEIVAGDNLYGGTYQLLHYTFEKLGRKTRFVKSDRLEEYGKAIMPGTKAIYIETIGNPKLDVPDFEAIAKIARDAGIPLVVDNTVATGFFRPFEHGADIEVLSATKYIGGHGTTVGVVIVDSGKFDWGNGKFPEITDKDPSYHGLSYWDAFHDVGGVNLAYILKARVHLLRDLGPALSPFNSFLFLQGLEDLRLRQRKHSENALAVARHLEKHPKVKFVNYPGLESFFGHKVAAKYLKGTYGGLVGFEVKGGVPAGKKFIESVRLLSHLANIGDAKTLVIHPASTTHQQLTPEEQISTGVTPEYIRLSVGLEDAKDIIADIDQALDKT